MAIGDYWELVLLGLDGLLAFGFYKVCTRISYDANNIEDTPVITVGPELHSSVDKAPNKCLPYIGISGITKISNDAYLESPNVGCVGLIHESSIIEHKSTRIQGFWNEVTRNISSVLRACRFGIARSDISCPGNIPTDFVEVSDPLMADYLIDNLPVIFSNFQPSKEGFLSRSFDRLFGETVRGYQFTEKMLPEGTPLLGIGKVYLASGISGKPAMFIGPPDGGTNKYILTTLTKSEIVRSLRSEAKVVRYLYYAFVLTGTALTVYLAYKYFKRNARTSRRSISAVLGDSGRIEAGMNSGLPMSSPIMNGTLPCAVCLSAQKNILLMPCRHLTMCSTCFESLPAPKKCPVCRTVVKECLPIYIT